nr:hypothetical protein [uncultured Olsenella sp.]
MRPTDEERRVVAARLREADREWRELGEPWAIEDLMQAVGFRTYEDADDLLLVRLADLMDPTCHAVEELEPDGVGAPPRYTIHCSRCGQLWDETGGVSRSPAYCPNCGARVTEGEMDE